jgi:HEPN domain-containing protein
MWGPSIDDLKTLAELRLADAKVLYRSKRYSGAYYLAGYSVECGLKAVIAAEFRQGVIPQKRFVDKVHTHDIVQLLKLSGLEPHLRRDMRGSTELQAAWAIVSSWSESSRYDVVDQFRATAMVNAVGHSRFGVLTWLKLHW